MKKRNAMAWYMAILLGIFGAATVGCDEMEEAGDGTGDAIEEAAENTGNAIEEAADETVDAAENATDEIDQEM